MFVFSFCPGDFAGTLEYRVCNSKRLLVILLLTAYKSYRLYQISLSALTFLQLYCINLFKEEAQTAFFKAPVRTAL